MIADQPSDFVSLAAVANAEAAADAADLAASRAWEAVEQATRYALRLEQEADRLRTVAERIALQLGFRKPS